MMPKEGNEGVVQNRSSEEERTRLRVIALSRWENEGGAGRPHQLPDDATPDAPPMNNAELVQLRIRVIALENIVIAMLAQAQPRQHTLVREMAVYISPRPGFCPHPLTIHAANEMRSLVDRADRFRSSPLE
jgi:hypothetical protein